MIVTGLQYKTGTPVRIETEGALIKSIREGSVSTAHLVGPGFFDLQVNGFAGLDYNVLYDDPTTLHAIPAALAKEGTTQHLATVITNEPKILRELLQQIAKASDDRLFRTAVPGIHLEGPFISPLDGPRGAHPKENVRPPDIELFKMLFDAAEGMIRMITLSPEYDGSPQLIEYCVSKGIIVAIGHTAATPVQIVNAVRAGATLSTHLGNGMHQMIARHPNYLWSQLAEDDLGATFIADGFHVPAEVLRVFQKVKNNNSILVSDSVSVAGMPPGDYDLHVGGRVTLTAEGRVHLRENPGLLAGSARSLRQCISFMVRARITDLPTAWEMASVRPLKLLGFDKTFSAGGSADLVCLEMQQEELAIGQTIVGGHEVFRSTDRS